MDAVLTAQRREPIDELGRQQFGELPSHRRRALDTGQPFDFIVPTADPILEIGRENADVDRLDDVLVKLLQALVFVDLALQRMVEARVLDGDADIVGERLEQLDVVTGEEVPFSRA